VAGTRVAIVDSGVHAAHPHVGGVSGGESLVGGGGSDDYVDRLGHGTAVAAVVREKAPGCELYAIRIFGDRLATDVGGLVRGIERAADWGAALINLSLGTANQAHRDALAAAVAYARERGALVVSPADHEGTTWWPGALEHVVGVGLDWALPRHRCRVERTGGGRLRVWASGYPRPIPGVPPERNLKGISFAAANVTGLLARAAPAGRGPLALTAVAALLEAASASWNDADGSAGDEGAA
jgi:subtilisin family serine protease